MKSFASFLLFVSLFFHVHAVLAWSWKDIKLGVTSEETIVGNVGEPDMVRLAFKVYQEIRKGLPPSLVKYDYGCTKFNPEKFVEILPLSADYIHQYEAGFTFENGRVKDYKFTFHFQPTPVEEFITDLGAVFGKAQKYHKTGGGSVKMIWYENHIASIINDEQCWISPLGPRPDRLKLNKHK